MLGSGKKLFGPGLTPDLRTDATLAQNLRHLAAFCSCVPTGMYGPTCIFGANLAPFSLWVMEGQRPPRPDHCSPIVGPAPSLTELDMWKLALLESISFSQIIHPTGACTLFACARRPRLSGVARPRPGHGSYELAFATKAWGGRGRRGHSRLA